MTINQERPSYEELANSFAEYLSCTSNDGAVAAFDDVLLAEENISRAQAVVDAAGGRY